MAVFRIERNRDYTVMSNHHLRDTELSLKSKGLVCFDIKSLGKQLKNLGMLVIQDQVWNRVTVNRSEGTLPGEYQPDQDHGGWQ